MMNLTKVCLLLSLFVVLQARLIEVTERIRKSKIITLDDAL